MIIRKLNPDLINQIRSNSEISSLSNCILQLIYNSIDAGASKIFAKFNVDDFFIEVADDGSGIDENGLELIGQNYVTSKLDNLKSLDSIETYGYRGQSLANIINLSESVEIVTKSNKESNIYSSKTFSSNISKSKLIHKVSLIPELFNISTIIKVHNLFNGNKLRQEQLRSDAKSLNSLIKKIQIISLVNHDINFYVKDLDRNIVLLNTGKTETTKDQFYNIFGPMLNTNLMSHNFCSSVKGYEINGFIYSYNKDSLTSNFQFGLQIAFSSSSKLQFIFVNKFFIQNSDLYDLVANELGSCREFNLLSYRESQLVFCLKINCPKTDFSLSFLNDSDKVMVLFKTARIEEAVRDMLKQYVRTFLNDYGYKEMKNTGDLNKLYLNLANGNKEEFTEDYGKQICLETLKYSKISKCVNISNKRQIKMVSAYEFDSKKHNFKQLFQKCINKRSKRKMVKHKLQLELTPTFTKAKRKITMKNKEVNDLARRLNFFDLQKRFAETNSKINTKKCDNKSTQTIKVETISNSCLFNLRENWISMIDSHGVPFFLSLIDGTTTYNQNEVMRSPVRFKINEKQSSDDFIKPLFKFNEASNHVESAINSFKNLIEKNNMIKWRNKEEFLRNKNLITKELNPFDANDKTSQSCLKLDLDLISSIKFGKNIFRTLKTVGQFDRKFIVTHSFASKINCYLIFLFDQHACHERIRLEQIIQENLDSDHNVISESLNQPIEIELDQVYQVVFEIFKLKMQTYGFFISLVKCNSNNTANHQGKMKLLVEKIPTIFSKKFRRYKEEVMVEFNSLIQRQLRNCFLNYKNKTFQIENDNKVFNISKLPSELVETFNMEACRGAIKFGDLLERNSCQTIITNLEKCNLPFQCAHGRPSLVPIANVFRD